MGCHVLGKHSIVPIFLLCVLEVTFSCALGHQDRLVLWKHVMPTIELRSSYMIGMQFLAELTTVLENLSSIGAVG